MTEEEAAEAHAEPNAKVALAVLGTQAEACLAVTEPNGKADVAVAVVVVHEAVIVGVHESEARTVLQTKSVANEASRKVAAVEA